MEFVGKLCQFVMSGIRRLCCGDDEQDCVMVDAVGSGHLAVSECRLNIGHAIPSHTTPYQAIPHHTTPYQTIAHHTMACGWHSTVPLDSVPLNIGWAHLAEPIAQGHPPLCCLITLHCIVTSARSEEILTVVTVVLS